MKDEKESAGGNKMKMWGPSDEMFPDSGPRKKNSQVDSAPINEGNDTSKNMKRLKQIKGAE